MSILSGSWSPMTASDPTTASIRPGDPTGQCAVTALLVQDLLGGDLLRTINEGESHYWNRLPDGTEIDLTRGQFSKWEPGEIVIRDRQYVLSHPGTARRYYLLLGRVVAGLSVTASEVFTDSTRSIATPVDHARPQHNWSHLARTETTGGTDD